MLRVRAVRSLRPFPGSTRPYLGFKVLQVLMMLERLARLCLVLKNEAP